ncbi:hypothetical protein N7520_002390 [Penicillium odoratum]|uniref:uncharacterized protein n=1 Tax=Penicillium odoratum TaxID=1167516 RepID=UPI0025489BC8|nr:uncharacterized protein N7520_002390 [Penicillium odoratum]KAJ5771861.1 hypothetical protein N7520_002390 [Penicillium odoratum]
MPFTHHDYTVAWICALPLEMTAAMTMLDNLHCPLSQPKSDHNAYTFGSISGHNVVIACLPSGVYGTTSAAVVLAQMLPTFPSLRFGLMVGIGGGVPSKDADIRLGDVVVSIPTAISGGVVQYDYGKTLCDGCFVRTGSLNKPPQCLLNTISKMRSKNMGGNTVIEETISKILLKNEKLQKLFSRPDKDWLFQANYDHEGTSADCSKCDMDQLVVRKTRESKEPVIHYGLIASGNQVMKSAKTRDAIARKLDILCFEMEAAGLMDQLPCLVIRGICDYSDSHKHKEWQGFAALAAAAYTKELLSAVRLASNTMLPKQVVEFSEKQKACLAKLFVTEPEEDLNELKTWFRPKKAASDIEENVLWLYGNPGIGKSTMAMTLAEELPKKDYFLDDDSILSFYFCDAGSEPQRKGTSILRGLLYQIIKQYPAFIEQVFSKYEIQGERLFTSFDALWATLLDIGRASQGGEIYCIVDALDECEPESRDVMLQLTHQSFKEARETSSVPSSVHLLIISRPYPEINECLDNFRRVDLGTYKEIANDLRDTIKDKVQELTRQKKYSESVAREVLRILKEKADGTFLWVGIACEELKRVQSRKAVETLRARPRGLNPLYKTLLSAATEASDTNDYPHMKMVLVIVTFALRPLTVVEIAEACRLYLEEDIVTRLQFTREIIDLCRLLLVVNNGYVRLLHTSVQDFLMTEMHEIKVDRSHYELSSRCIEVILQYYRSDMDRSSLEPTDGFLSYSVLHWLHHACLARKEFAVQKDHERFFKKPLDAWEYWLNNYNHLSRSLWGGLGTNISPIHVAARWGIIPLIFKLLEERLEDKDIHETPPLLVATKHTQYDAIRVLVDCGAFLDALNDEHQNVLHVACKNIRFKDSETIKFLLDKGASPYLCDEYNMIPFLYAIGNRQEKLARAFLQDGFDLNTRVRRRSWPGRKTVIMFPYTMSERQENKLESKLTALHFCALNASIDMTAFLLRCGADPNARSSFGDTALHIGIRGRLLGRKNDDEWQNSQYSIESLRDLITDHESSEAFDIYQAIEDARIRIVETLLESKSINLNMANNQGDYPQHVIDFDRPYAASILDRLVERGVDISQPNRAGQTCLHLASIAGNLEVIRKLVEGNHDITLQDANGLSSFHYALSHGSLEVLQFISSACDSLTLETWHSIDHFGKTSTNLTGKETLP